MKFFICVVGICGMYIFINTFVLHTVSKESIGLRGVINEQTNKITQKENDSEKVKVLIAGLDIREC